MKGPGGVFCAGLYNDYHLCQSWSLTCMLYNHNLNSRCIIVSADTIGETAVSSAIIRLWCSVDANMLEVQAWSGRKVRKKSPFYRYIQIFSSSVSFVNLSSMECCHYLSCNVSTLCNWHCVWRSIKVSLKWSSGKHMIWWNAEHCQL